MQVVSLDEQPILLHLAEDNNPTPVGGVPIAHPRPRAVVLLRFLESDNYDRVPHVQSLDLLHALLALLALRLGVARAAPAAATTAITPEQLLELLEAVGRHLNAYEPDLLAALLLNTHAHDAHLALEPRIRFRPNRLVAHYLFDLVPVGKHRARKHVPVLDTPADSAARAVLAVRAVGADGKRLVVELGPPLDRSVGGHLLESAARGEVA
mmetsp:Transcript_33483/g.71473  ORF Transcript_33483/g.71473 Transcript_33483/m.71473 type:complete len:210 (+) Transcript_33483:757-1386(+)